MQIDRQRALEVLKSAADMSMDVPTEEWMATLQVAIEAIKAQPEKPRPLIIGTDIHCYDCAFDGENRDRKKQRCLKGIDGTNGCGLWIPKGKGAIHE